jgi:hypothetical protein
LDTSIDRHNARTLAEIVRHHGWPGPALVGNIGARKAWLLAQHADLNPMVQRGFLHAMKMAQRDAPHPILEESIRLLQDRIAYMVKHYRWYSLAVRHPSVRRRISKSQRSNR